jgi:hypothetical protein
MITTIEESIKFWRDKLGMNTIPPNTRNKKPLVDWKRWQTEGIPDQLQMYWITHDKFANGINVILGKIHHSVGLKFDYGTQQSKIAKNRLRILYLNREGWVWILSTFKNVPKLQSLTQFRVGTVIPFSMTPLMTVTPYNKASDLID